MHIDEVPILEKAVDGMGRQGPDPEHRRKGVAAGPQVGDGAQILQRVPLLLEGVIAVGFRLDDDALRLDLIGLLGFGVSSSTPSTVRAAAMPSLETSLKFGS